MGFHFKSALLIFELSMGGVESGEVLAQRLLGWSGAAQEKR